MYFTTIIKPFKPIDYIQGLWGGNDSASSPPNFLNVFKFEKSLAWLLLTISSTNFHSLWPGFMKFFALCQEKTEICQKKKVAFWKNNWKNSDIFLTCNKFPCFGLKLGMMSPKFPSFCDVVIALYWIIAIQSLKDITVVSKKKNAWNMPGALCKT